MKLKQDLSQTLIQTKHGKLNIRVYKNHSGLEDVIIWTEEIDTCKPVFLRVHSECFTGDVLGSLQCDCGAQLQQSLDFIASKGGVLIYLRQEGRGIGLYEKIKAYNLQAKNIDTFDANILLGHEPDKRTYFQVKEMLDDLNVSHVRLITNNPSKISNITRLGIKVVEQVPLHIKPSKYNQTYYKTKIDKFQHSLDGVQKTYFYQFHAEDPDFLREIKGYLENKNTDPLLQILIGINANSSSISTKKNKNKLRQLFFLSNKLGFTPVLHYSFNQDNNFLKTIQKIKLQLPFVKRLHINDFPNLRLSDLKKAHDFFILDIPLNNDNFHLVENPKFVNFIKKNNLFVFLDNSKGKGISENVDTFKHKINLLLNKGLNRIALCGGFGPNRLTDFFTLTDFYKINFSIDAETYLKTKGRYDTAKTKIFLSQLMRTTTQQNLAISQTRDVLKKSLKNTQKTIAINGKKFLIEERVFHPGFFPSTSWFASVVIKHIRKKCDFCEIGCGAGIISSLVALASTKNSVVASDISLFAYENTRKNILKHKIMDQVQLYEGNVFDSIPKKKKFDYIFWALPFGYLNIDKEISIEERQVFDPGYQSIRKFFKDARTYLKPHGELLIGFSPDLGHPIFLKRIAEEFSVKLESLQSTIIKEKNEAVFELLKGTYT